MLDLVVDIDAKLANKALSFIKNKKAFGKFTEGFTIMILILFGNIFDSYLSAVICCRGNWQPIGIESIAIS